MSQYYLPFTPQDLFKCGTCRGFGWKRKIDNDSFQRAGMTSSHLLAAWGRCNMQVGIKKEYFSRLLYPFKKMAGKMLHSQFPMQNTVAEHFWQALVALQYQGQDLSIWLHCACGIRVTSRWTHTAQECLHIELSLYNMIVEYLGNL